MNDMSALDISLGNLESNICELQKLTNKNIVFMVKANAYGHGLVPIVDFAHHECGIKSFGVASINEAKKLVKAFPGFSFELYVFSGFSLREQSERDFIIEHNVTPVISHENQLDLFLADDRLRNTELALKINIGMNRLGFDDLDQLERKLKGKKIDHLMGHFSSAYFPSDETMMEQKKYFDKALTFFQDHNIEVKRSSVSNSAAIEQSVGLENTDIRPGLMLYGPSSCSFFGEKNWKGKVISSLKSTVIHHRFIKAGEHVGYGNTKIKENGHLYHIPLGYGDGLFQQYTNAKIKLNDHYVKILGRISMDITCIFSKTDILKIGDKITLWDEQNNFDSLSKHSRIIPYQMTTAISERVVRRYYE